MQDAPASAQADTGVGQHADANASVQAESDVGQQPGSSAQSTVDGGLPGRGCASGNLEDARASVPAESDAGQHLGSWARSTVDRILAGRICASSNLEELSVTPVPFEAKVHGANPRHLGTWMIWMVHRLALNDPSLTELDFSTYALPLPEDEPRIARKLWVALARNTHLTALRLEDSNLRGGEDEGARGLAAALATNRVLRVLDVSSNFLGPRDLEQVFGALVRNTALEELRCSNQFCEPMELATYNVLAEALRQNRSLRKLGLELRDSHHRDQINRALVRNAGSSRRKLRRRRPGGG